MHNRIFGTPQATALVMAAMIGTGVFTSLGLQVQSIPSTSAVLLLWVLGGVSSLCGALAYAELGAAHPRSGGEYHLLATAYTSTLGFIAGVATLIAGLAAPMAVSAVAFSKYMHNLVPLPSPVYIVGVIVLTTILHSVNVRVGAVLHSGITYFNVALMLVFIIAALVIDVPNVPPPMLVPTADDLRFMLSPSYAVAFVFVVYAYLGWNTSVYIIDELHEPQQTLPRSVIIGVLAVTVLYVVLNYAFLNVASLADLSGKVDVGYIAARGIVGEQAAVLMSTLIALALFASVSSYTVLSPRVWRVMGEDYGTNYALLRLAARTNVRGVPTPAFWLQAALALGIALSSTFDAILIYTGILLTAFNMLAVLGVIVLRVRHPELPRPYRAWGYPLTPVVFALVSLWMIGYSVLERPWESLWVALTFVGGYALNARNLKPKH
jgi:APA family basic amino acid/polyamine antiporter